MAARSSRICALSITGFGRPSPAGEYWALLTASAESGGGAGARFLASETAGKIAPLASTVISKKTQRFASMRSQSRIDDDHETIDRNAKRFLRAHHVCRNIRGYGRLF